MIKGIINDRNFRILNDSYTNKTNNINNLNFDYEYNAYTVCLGIVICLIGSYNSLEIIQNIKYINKKNTIIFLLFLASFSFSTISVWSTYFIFIYSMTFKEIDIYIDLRLAFFCILSAILCNITGFCISYLPFLDRTYKEYKKKILSNFFLGNINNIHSILNKNNIKNLTIKNKFSKQFTNNNFNNNINQNNNNHNSNNFSISNLNDMSASNISLHAMERLNSNFKKIGTKINENKSCDIYNISKDDFYISQYFNTNAFKKKEIVYFVIGIFIIGMSVLIIQFLGVITAIKINGEIKFYVIVQFLISFMSFGASVCLHLIFYFKEKIWLKSLLTFIMTICICCFHFISINYVIFQKFQNSDSLNNLNSTNQNQNILYDNKLTDTNGLIKIDQLSMIILIFIVLIPYVIKDVLNVNLKKSYKMIQYVGEYTSLGKDELSIILGFCETIRPQEINNKKNYHQNRENNENIFQENKLCENDIIENENYNIKNKGIENKNQSVRINNRTINNQNDEDQ